MMLCATALVLTGCSRGALGPSGTAVAGEAASPPWPSYQLRSDHNAVVRSDSLIGSWTFDVRSRINGGLAVDGETVYADAFDHTVMALRLEDGALRWRTAVPNVVMSTPIVVHGRVFVGTGTNQHIAPTEWGRPEGDAVLALDAASGKVLWSFKTTGEDMPSPVYVGDRLVFANGDGHAYALDPETGKLLWRTPLKGISTMASATTDGHTVFLSTCTLDRSPGLTFAIDAASGAIRWQSPYGNCDSSPALAQNQLFVSGIRMVRTSYGVGYKAVAASLDAASGKPKWVHETEDAGFSSTFASSERAIAGTFAGATYYVSFPTHDRLVAFDSASGRIRWSLRTLAPVKMSPIVRAGTLFAGDTAGCFYSIDARDGSLRSLRTFDAPFSTSPPVLVNDMVVVSVGQTIRALPLRGGLLPPGANAMSDHH